MVTKILVIGEELKDQLTQYMVVERVEVAKLESIGGVQFDKEVGLIILDTSVVPLVSETFQRLREQVKVPLLAAVSTYEEAKLALELGCEEIVVKPFNLLVKTCIKRLRKKIEDKTCKRRYIVAVRGVGYRIEL